MSYVLLSLCTKNAERGLRIMCRLSDIRLVVASEHVVEGLNVFQTEAVSLRTVLVCSRADTAI